MPVVVQIGRRMMRLADIMSLVPGAIIEFPKSSDEDLEVLINNKEIGTGKAVKIGENFGVQITFVGDIAQRVEALGQAGGIDAGAPAESAAESKSSAEQALAGQSG